jgi:hypothetical protein
MGWLGRWSPATCACNRPFLSRIIFPCSTITTMHVHGNRFKQYLPNDVVCLFTQKTKKITNKTKKPNIFFLET